MIKICFFNFLDKNDKSRGNTKKELAKNSETKKKIQTLIVSSSSMSVGTSPPAAATGN